MVIGVSGYTGSGKSTVAKYLCERHNFALIDADKTARKLMLENSELISKVGKAFGLVQNGKIDFAQLGNIAFESAENLQTLNSITFPYILSAIKEGIASLSRPLVLDAALLPLISPKEICTFAIWVESEISQRIKRLQKRTDLSVDAIKNRIEKQIQLMSKPQDGGFWRFVDNNSTEESLFSKVSTLLSASS